MMMSEKVTFKCNQCETRITEGEDTWGLCETCASKVDWDAMTERGEFHWKHLFHPDSEEVQKSLTLEQHIETIKLTEEMRRARQAEAIVSGIEAAYKGEDGDTYAQEYGVYELTDTHITLTLDGLVRILNEAKAEEQHDE